MTERLALFFLACAISTIGYCLIIPRPLTFEQRWEPVKFIVPFTRGA